MSNACRRILFFGNKNHFISINNHFRVCAKPVICNAHKLFLVAIQTITKLQISKKNAWQKKNSRVIEWWRTNTIKQRANNESYWNQFCCLILLFEASANIINLLFLYLFCYFIFFGFVVFFTFSLTHLIHVTFRHPHHSNWT